MAKCPSCGTENPDVARFCMACTTPLGPETAAQAEERKVVSVLFVDLVGFTARSHKADPEDVRAALGPYHSLLKREIERFGGTVEKFIGDAVMAVFGAPVAHEDDAERAVRAGLRIIDALDELNEASPGLELAVRAAVNTGEGLVALSARPEAGETLVTGDVVNTASRLQNVAPVGGVAVGELTYRYTRDVIDYVELDPVSLKGKPEPVRLWQARSARSRFGVETQASYATPFVGRELDLGTLRHVYHRTLAESSLQLVTIVGEPGVGKSRLLAELSNYVDDQTEVVSWRQGRCLPYGDGITFWALGEIVKAHTGILESDPATEAAVKLTAAVAAVIEDESERPWFVARLGALVGTGSSQPAGEVTTEESFTAWRRFLEAVAVARPLIVVFEDLHWGDAALLGFIEHLVEWVTGVPLMVVCTARPELYEKHPGWGAGMRNAATISLSPLSDHETAQLVSALLSRAVLPGEVHAALLDRAGGNPLYAEEFVRMLSDSGVLQRRGTVVSLDPHADIAIPETVQALIAARLDTLSPERKALLHDAAVAGKVFWSGALAAIGDVTEESVIQGLHELTRKEIVRPARTSSMAGQHEYSFWHALIKDVSYAQIPRAGRIQKHRAMATWIETRAGDRIADHAEVLAHHYGEALALATAAGDDATVKELEGPAIRFLIAAADRAAELDMATAGNYYGRALELVAPGTSGRAGLLIKAGMVALHRGRLEEAFTHLEEATAEARDQGDRRAEGYAMARLASVMWFQGETERSNEVSAEAVALLEREPAGAELVYAYHRLADIAQFSGDAPAALERAEKALIGAKRIGDDVELVGALAAHGAVRCSLGDLGGLDSMKQALKDGLTLGLAGATSYVYSELSDWTWRNDGARAGYKLYKEAAEFEDRRGMTASAAFTRAESLRPLFDLGCWDELNNLADELLDDPKSSTYVEAIALIAKAHVVVLRGQPGEGDSLTGRLLALARSIKDLQVLVPALAVASLMEWMRGDAGVATALIAELEEMTRRNMWRCRYLPVLTRILVSAGDADRVDALLCDAPAITSRDRNSVVAAEAIVTEAHDELERALGLYDDVAERWRDYGFVLERGYALFGSGRCLLRLDRRDEARSKLHEAREDFTDLEARPLTSEIDRHLGEAEALSS